MLVTRAKTVESAQIIPPLEGLPGGGASFVHSSVVGLYASAMGSGAPSGFAAAAFLGVQATFRDI